MFKDAVGFSVVAGPLALSSLTAFSGILFCKVFVSACCASSPSRSPSIGLLVPGLCCSCCLLTSNLSAAYSFWLPSFQHGDNGRGFYRFLPGFGPGHLTHLSVQSSTALAAVAGWTQNLQEVHRRVCAWMPFLWPSYTRWEGVSILPLGFNPQRALYKKNQYISAINGFKIARASH